MVEQVAISWMNGWAQDGAALAIRANNLAFHYANSNYLLFLNPDCLVYPGTLGEMLGVIDARSDVGMTSCLTRNLYGMEQAGCCRSIDALAVAGVGATPRPIVRRGQAFSEVSP
jgi:hypothetical protein